MAAAIRPQRGKLTRAQAQVYRILVDYFTEHLCLPTLREVASAAGIAAVNGVLGHLRALEAKGWLRRGRGGSRRGWELTAVRVEVTEEDVPEVDDAATSGLRRRAKPW